MVICCNRCPARRPSAAGDVDRLDLDHQYRWSRHNRRATALPELLALRAKVRACCAHLQDLPLTRTTAKEFPCALETSSPDLLCDGSRREASEDPSSTSSVREIHELSLVLSSRVFQYDGHGWEIRVGAIRRLGVTRHWTVARGDTSVSKRRGDVSLSPARPVGCGNPSHDAAIDRRPADVSAGRVFHGESDVTRCRGPARQSDGVPSYALFPPPFL